MPNPTYSHFGYLDRSADPLTGKYLPVSTTSNWQWITVPWDVDYADPEDQHVLNGGWTFLYGPCDFVATGGVRLLLQQDDASVHVRLWVAEIIDGVDTRVGSPGESYEWFVGPGETGNSHINGTWIGRLTEGQRLRMEVDYWHAAHGARIIGGSVKCLVWRPEV